ncbi:perlucin-like protein [Asterias rubens]|uniref:perlucin-like protein n=1 Tax=Asterias rubens TaxID=7604 RepID=UPI00145546FC|nr:perlucin-like protein [Asterias rubens]
MEGTCLHSVLLILFTIGMSSAHSCKPQMLCPFGWESWGGSCYKLLEGKPTWPEGFLKCQEIGGEMVLPSSSEENNYLYILSNNSPKVWVNCNDLKIEGQWDCNDNGGYVNWVNGEPKGGTRENCALAHFTAWNDYPCSYKHANTLCKGNEVTATQAKLKQWRLLASCLTGHTLREIPTSNVRACAIECDYDPRCHSFNVQHFGTGERICQLNLRIRSEADHTQFVKSKKPFTCIYGEK